MIVNGIGRGSSGLERIIKPFSEIGNGFQDFVGQTKSFCRMKKIFFPK